MKSDVFFFVTTICVFIVTSLLIMILVEVHRVAKNIRTISDMLRGHAEDLSSDFAAFRATLHNSQFGLKPIFDGIKKAASIFSKSKAKGLKKKRTPSAVAKENTETESEFI